MHGKYKRKVCRTLLIVGEGRHEKAFLDHVRSIFVSRGGGLKVTTKQAGGKGAAHVLDFTCRQIRNAQYDCVAIMLDTDEGWSGAVERRAHSKGIILMKSIPRYEAMLLRILAENPSEDASSEEHKRQFSPFVNGKPEEMGSYATHFSEECLLEARKREEALAKLLELLGVPTEKD